MNAQILAFQPTTAARQPARAPDPSHAPADTLPDREWGLTAGQVVAIVLVIIAGCQLFGLVF